MPGFPPFLFPSFPPSKRINHAKFTPTQSWDRSLLRRRDGRRHRTPRGAQGAEDLRPAETVTICLPLFLAGGEGDRAFAKFYPTIAVDGCEKRCAPAYGAIQQQASRQPAGR